MKSFSTAKVMLVVCDLFKLGYSVSSSNYSHFKFCKMLFLLQVAFDAFACYAKSLAIALLFFFPSLFLGRMANVFANVLWFVTQEPCNQERAYINDMPCAYIPCALEIYSNGGVKQEHVESCPSTTKNISQLPQCLWQANFEDGDLPWGTIYQ